MPIYEYACAACGHTFEEWQKMSDAPVRTCPKCKKKKVEKLISHTAFQLKGGGWYADLYSSSKSGSQKPDGKESSGSAQESKDGKDSKDSKDGKDGKDGKGAGNSGASEAGTKGADSGASASKRDGKGDAKDAKKKDSPKKSEARAA